MPPWCRASCMDGALGPPTASLRAVGRQEICHQRQALHNQGLMNGRRRAMFDLIDSNCSQQMIQSGRCRGEHPVDATATVSEKSESPEWPVFGPLFMLLDLPTPRT